MESARSSPRSTWTDERLDDLSQVVERGFNRVDEDLRSLRTELSARIDAQGVELSGRMDTLERRIDAQGIDLGARIDTQGAELGARIDAQGTELSGRIDTLSGRIDALQRLMIQIGATMTALMLVTLLSVLLTRA